MEAGLGKLVQFDRRNRRPQAGPALAVPAAPGGAKIYIFTGVRYQRDDAPVPGKPLGGARVTHKRG